MSNNEERDREQQEPEVVTPKYMKIEKRDNELHIFTRWRHREIAFTFGCLFGIGALVLFLVNAITEGVWVGVTVLIPFVTMTIGGFYYFMATCVNSRYIRANPEELIFHTRPLPVPSGNQRFATNNITHLEHSEDTRHQRTINILRIFNRTSIWYTYKVSAVLRDGTTKALLRDLENDDQALFVKQELERFLRLEEREVQGEYRKPEKKVYQTQIKTEIRDNVLHVFIKKFHWAFLGGAFIFAPFAGIMVWATIHTFEKGEWPIGIIAILVSLGLLLLVYFFIATCVDTHHIKANPEELTLHTGPLPFPRGNKRFVATNIEQVECKKKTHRTDHRSMHEYRIHVVLKDGSNKVLMYGLNGEEAREIRRQIDRFLKIKDKRI